MGGAALAWIGPRRDEGGEISEHEQRVQAARNEEQAKIAGARAPLAAEAKRLTSALTLAQADAVCLRSVLTRLVRECEKYHCKPETCSSMDAALGMLDVPYPGQALLDELATLRAEVKRLREFVQGEINACPDCDQQDHRQLECKRCLAARAAMKEEKP
jgi:hypothetical protein